MQIAFLLSILLHIVALIFMLLDFVNPFESKTLLREIPVHVEFAKIEKETKAPVLSPQKKIIEKPTEEPIQEQKASEGDENKKPEKIEKPIEAPKKIEKEEPVEEKKPEKVVEKKETPLPAEKQNKKEEVKVKEKEKLKEKEKEKKKQPDSEKKAVTNVNKKQEKKAGQKNKKETLDDLLDTPTKNKEGAKKTQGLNASKEGPIFTTSEIARLKAHISKCWNIHAGAKDAKDHIVDVEIHLNKEGYVEKAEILNKQKVLNDPFYKVAAETAQRSLLDPDCNPLPIPNSDYKNWSKIVFRFNPKDMF